MIFKTLLQQSTYVIKILLLNIEDLSKIADIDNIEKYLRDTTLPLSYYKVDYSDLYKLIREDLIEEGHPYLITDMDLKVAIFLIMFKIYSDNIFKVK